MVKPEFLRTTRCTSLKTERHLPLAVVLTLWSCFTVSAQQTQRIPDSAIRATTRVVLVDAIVTDAASRVVSGLTASDFTVMEDGKPQKISFFSFESRTQRKVERPPRPLRSDVYTNRPEYHSTSDPLVVLLLDGLNTPPGQQVYVRQQILKYLGNLKLSGPGTAILALGNDLSVLQDFTTDSQLLSAAVSSYKGGRTAVDIESPRIDVPVTTGPGGGIPAQANVQAPPEAGRGGIDEAADVAPGTNVLNSLQELADSLKRFERNVTVDEQDVRVRTTLAALRSIGHSVSGYPGRKALLWFSASFPFNLAPEESMDLEFSKSYRTQLSQTAVILADANVAVYPIDARGLLTAGALADPSIPATSGVPSKSLASATWHKFNTEATMDHLARDTGGKVFRNTNDLNAALQDAITDSESYYMLGYYPERKNWDGRFRNIKVALADKHLKIRSRTGYFAVDPADWRKSGDGKQMISPAALHTLTATGILFYAHPEPPEKKGQPVTVEILVDASTVSFGSGPDFTQNTDLEFQAGAFTPDGKLARLETQVAQADLRPETYQQIMKNGISIRVPLSLKPGRYLLRVAVRDNRNGHIGTLDVPLHVQ
ncbi:MAG TPA: VWA domain-containing protein [Terriglobia bacterium]|nr:VWA domain-containing protein [Terriglobia bacterium]